MKKKTDDRKENAKFEKFKKDILPKLTYYNVHAMGQDEINISKDMLLADKASSYVLQSKKCAELIINIIFKCLTVNCFGHFFLIFFIINSKNSM